jgi:hypothetical protein
MRAPIIIFHELLVTKDSNDGAKNHDMVSNTTALREILALEDKRKVRAVAVWWLVIGLDRETRWFSVSNCRQ